MKKIFYHLTIIALLSIKSVVAADLDVTPLNWKFSQMQIGSARSLFLEQSARIGSNVNRPFRDADGRDGAFAVNDWRGYDVNYVNMSEDQKKSFSDFYDAWRIADAGAMGKVLIYQGKNSTGSDGYNRALKNINTLNAPGLLIISQSNLETGQNYEVEFTLRVIMNNGASSNKFNMYTGTSWWDPIAGNGDYKNFDLNVNPAFNNTWITYKFNFYARPNSDPNYKFFPFTSKLGIPYDLANAAIIMFHDFKLTKKDVLEVYPAGSPRVRAELNDTPGPNATILTPEQNAIVSIHNKIITVIDANAPVIIYSVTGKQLYKNSKPTLVTEIGLNNPGCYLLKIGNSIRKVIVD